MPRLQRASFLLSTPKAYSFHNRPWDYEIKPHCWIAELPELMPPKRFVFACGGVYAALSTGENALNGPGPTTPPSTVPACDCTSNARLQQQVLSVAANPSHHSQNERPQKLSFAATSSFASRGISVQIKTIPYGSTWRINSSCRLPQLAPSARSAILSSLTAVSTSSKFSAEMAHLACFCAATTASSSRL